MNEEIIEVFDDTLMGAKVMAKGMLVVMLFPLRLAHALVEHFLNIANAAVSDIDID